MGQQVTTLIMLIKKKQTQIWIQVWRHNIWTNEKENTATSIFWHSGNCLHDTDKVIFIVTELSKHIKQAASHDLPRKQRELRVSKQPANTQPNTQHWQSCQVHYTPTYLDMTGGLEPYKAEEHEKHEGRS